jgi:hypothetical protein
MIRALSELLICLPMVHDRIHSSSSNDISILAAIFGPDAKRNAYAQTGSHDLGGGDGTTSLAWSMQARAANEAEVVAEHLIELVQIGRVVVSEHQATIKGERDITGMKKEGCKGALRGQSAWCFR